jgi:NAD+ diphosphatase
MVGFYARAESSQTIRVDLDNELVDARWFTRAQVLAVVNGKRSANPFDAIEESTLNPDEGFVFTVPPATAIAGVLIRDWAEQKGLWSAGLIERSSVESHL